MESRQFFVIATESLTVTGNTTADVDQSGQTSSTAEAASEDGARRNPAILYSFRQLPSIEAQMRQRQDEEPWRRHRS